MGVCETRTKERFSRRSYFCKGENPELTYQKGKEKLRGRGEEMKGAREKFSNQYKRYYPNQKQRGNKH